MVSLDQFRAGFLTECDELLTEMEGLLVELTPESADRDMLNAIFRCAHSIKGGAGAFGLDEIARFTHVLEALLDAMREGQVTPARDVTDVLLAACDVVAQMVRAAKVGKNVPAGLGEEVLVRLVHHAGGVAAPSAMSPDKSVATEPLSQGQQWRISFSPHESLFASGNEPLLILRELAQLGQIQVQADISRILPLEALDVSQCFLSWQITLCTDRPESAIAEAFEFVEGLCDLRIAAAPETSQPSPDSIPTGNAVPDQARSNEQGPFMRRAGDGAASGTIRVDLEKVDKLVNMVGELVITEAMIKAQARDLSPEAFAGLLRGVEELSQHTRELQEAVMSVRMQPVKSIFARIPRVVRDLCAQLGKEITLQMSGESTEVDKTVIEQLGDPITHMIRNSADHGIELPQERVAAGKPAQGTIHLAAYHQGGRIIIEIRDDGRGINRTRVLEKAKQKGLIAADAQLSDEECDNLIFLPGFSTAEVVSNVSGRGVGMDVVRRNIEGLNGTVHLKSEPGGGSTFTVSLPLTLAILDGMIVRVGAEHYIIPITSIIETMRPLPGAVKPVEGACDVLNVRGEFVPVLYLHDIFRIAGAQPDANKALVVLVEAGREKLGIVVDELIGQQQVVIKSLEANTDPVAGISGATILGDGRVSLILEIAHLRQLDAQRRQPETRQAA